MKKQQQKAAILSAVEITLSAKKTEPLVNAIIINGDTYKLVKNPKEIQPCQACALVRLCEVGSFEPGICAIFPDTWYKYFRKV